MTFIEYAITIAGGQVKLGEMTGFSQQTVSYWKRMDRVSPVAAVAIEKATGISRVVLRPDIFE